MLPSDHLTSSPQERSRNPLSGPLSLAKRNAPIRMKMKVSTPTSPKKRCRSPRLPRIHLRAHIVPPLSSSYFAKSFARISVRLAVASRFASVVAVRASLKRPRYTCVLGFAGPGSLGIKRIHQVWGFNHRDIIQSPKRNQVQRTKIIDFRSDL